MPDGPNVLDPDIQHRLDEWSTDPASKAAIDRLIAQGDWDEIRDAFSTELTFGTAGLRGRMGVGPNRMNERIVSIATRALAGYLRELGAEQRGVVVSWDTRHGSAAFAERTRDILADQGVKVFAFEADRPVPELSFAIREMRAMAGVMITASHNPKDYNGYKVSWEHGGQIGQDIAAAILERMRRIGARASETTTRIDTPTPVPSSHPSKRPARGQVIVLGADMDQKYLARIDGEVLDREPLPSLRIVYDPLYGCGRTLVPAALIRAGVRASNMFVVEEHARAPAGKALGDFAGLKSPNPASAGVLDIAIQRAKAIEADLVLSTDPDSDRLVAGVPIGAGEYRVLRANETWPVLLDHRLRSLQASGKLSPESIVVRSWVTTRLLDKVAASYGIATIEVPTGFKWIAEQMATRDVIGGFEESDGMSVGSHTREKDAQLAAVLVAETAARARAERKTLAGLRDELYAKFGRHEAIVEDLTFEGVAGRRAIKRVSEALVQAPATVFGAREGARFEQRYDGARAFLPDDTVITVRPSGTEPKVKVYVEKVGRGDETVTDARRLLAETVDSIRRLAG